MERARIVSLQPEFVSAPPRLEHRSTLYRKWLLEMRRAKLFQPGDRVGVAVSGGGDSVLLFHYLCQFASESALIVSLVHFNHRLRGPESEADEAFVRQLAEAKGVEFIRQEADVKQASRDQHRNLEAVARDLRYRFFMSLVKHGVLDKVATAHTASDQAETVLLRLLRGAGTRGLAGIQRVRDKVIVRPFLNLTRPQVQEELTRLGLQFRLDSTNLDRRLARNKVRLDLLPWLEREFNPAIVRLLKDLADRATADEAWLEQQARVSGEPLRSHGHGPQGPEEHIPCSVLPGLPPALERRVLRQMIADATGGDCLAYKHIETIRAFARKSQSGRRLEFPRLVVRNEFGRLVVSRPQPGGLEGGAGVSGQNDSSGYCYVVRPPCQIAVVDLAVSFDFKIIDCGQARSRYNKKAVSSAEGGDLEQPDVPATVLIDPLKLPKGLILRSWRPADRFQPAGRRKPLKVKELLTRHRVPVAFRRFWPVLESGGEIVWVRGFPPGGTVLATSGRAIAIEERRLPAAREGRLAP